MTFGVPYSFVPGTKAKADEVNANFIDVLTKIDDIMFSKEFTIKEKSEQVLDDIQKEKVNNYFSFFLINNIIY